MKISKDPSGFVILADIVRDAILEIRYYSAYNFIGERIDGYEQPSALITEAAAQALKAAGNDLRQKGYFLKIYDAYRPCQAVRHFVRWAQDPGDTRMKEAFYPDVDKADLFRLGFIAERSSHSRGSTVDLTLVDMKTGRDLDMGGSFDYFGEISHSDFAMISEEQKTNRGILREAMVSHGFVPLKEEWWHFTLADEPYPDTYFDFAVSEASVKTRDTEVLL